MSRNLILIAIIGLLAACTTQGDGDTTDTSMDAAPTVSAAAAATATEGTGETAGTASAACTDAFASVEQDVSSLSAMADLPEVEATIEQCESVDDWMAGAEQVIGQEVNPSTAQLLLDIRCQLPALGDTAVCEEVAAS